ncbi:MAG: TetR/AcrR family transcriptional regulator [Clostridiales bacterium]|nr:TetR/AcrR family transcriptional regulator [Clostridiales bacterium]
MPKVTEEYIQNKKKRIIDAAYQSCLKKPISTVTMQDIIDQSGLSQGGIYRFYKDLDEVFGDMIENMREEGSIKKELDEILQHDDRSVRQTVEDLFELLSEFMEENLMTIEKIDFEFSMMAMNYPKRVEKIMNCVEGEGNTEYLVRSVLSYFEIQKEKGNISEQVDILELCAYISSVYSGIQMECILFHCYRNDKNPFGSYFQPARQMKQLCRYVISVLETADM